tara:strand:- start:315 stop:491 length:177 start_codon:yes stop_codon:yes gene_type:complete
MANCTKCNKVFTCGCQKATLSDGSIVCKNCKSAVENSADAISDLSRDLARQQIQNLRS